MHIFHNWQTIHFQQIKNEEGWFKHLKCKKCGKEIIRTKIKFFATISDAIDLGIITGIYRGFHPEIPVE